MITTNIATKSSYLNV